MISEPFEIVQAHTGRVLWAGTATREEAETKAVLYAINSGMVNLLSGDDLTRKFTRTE